MYCFLCCASRRAGNVGGSTKSFPNRRVIAAELRVFLEYLLDSRREPCRMLLQEEVLHRHSEVTLLEPNAGKVGMVRFCSECDGMISLLGKLHQELEVTQMKIAEVVRRAKKAVRNGKAPAAPQQKKRENEVKLLRRRFQAVVLNPVGEAEASELCIPLVYLNRVNAIPEKHLASSPGPASPASSSLGVDFLDAKPEPVENDNNSDVGVGECKQDLDSVAVKTEPEPDLGEVDCSTSNKSRLFNKKRKKQASSPTGPGSAPHRKSQRSSASAAKVRLKMITPPRPPKVKPERVSDTQRIRLEIMRRTRNMNPTYRRIGGGRKIRIQALMIKCEQCTFTTPSNFVLESHLRTTHEQPLEINFKCEDCKLGFTTQQYYEMHMIRHGTKWRCDVCEENVVAVEMRRHLEGHDGSTVYNCEHCDRPLGSLAGLVTHVIIHIGAKIACPLCPSAWKDALKEFKTRTEFPKHLHEHHGLEEFVFKCDHPGCSRTFYYHNLLLIHKVIHGDKLQCDQCGGKFNGEVALQKHVDIVHSNKKQFVCQECGCSFKYKQTLKSHIAREHDTQLWIQCELCDERENGERKKFLNRQNYEQHLWTQHRVGKPREFTCNQCPKVFSRKSLLMTHAETHALTKEYKCEVCGFETKTRKMLQRHNEHHHSHPRERKHLCSICERGFFTRHMLTDHMRTHTGERPYVCDECGSAFTQKSALNTHRKKRHSPP